jgi:hypothetical protein
MHSGVGLQMLAGCRPCDNAILPALPAFLLLLALFAPFI